MLLVICLTICKAAACCSLRLSGVVVEWNDDLFGPEVELRPGALSRSFSLRFDPLELLLHDKEEKKTFNDSYVSIQ